MDEILTEHPKGVEYAWILEGMDRYPLILDAEDKVLSFPPVINGTVTQVRDDTRDLFLDVTGLDEAACMYSLRILATMLAERGGQIEAVRVVYPDGEQVMPDLSPEQRRVSLGDILPWTGLLLTADEAARALHIMGYGAEVSEDGEHLDILVPSYRMDVLHDVDVAEDVSIGYGYERVVGTLPEVPTLSRDAPDEAIHGRLHTAFRGRGFTELLSFVLSSTEEQYTKMRLPVPDEVEMITNPITEHFTTLRTHVLPDLLSYLGKNTHHDYPQSVYEVGHVVIGRKNALRTAAVSVHAKAGFTQAKGLAEGVMRDLGHEKDVTIQAAVSPSYIPGRCAKVLVGGVEVGVFGELHPEVLEAFGLLQPTIVLELDLDGMM